eukprot:Ihof_evm3s326 gene=Ihof_evmTU3s326
MENKQHDTDKMPKHTLTPEESRVLQKCSSRFIRRGLLFATAATFITDVVIKSAQRIQIHQRPFYRVFFLPIMAYHAFRIGGYSTSSSCTRDIMMLENSVLADRLREREMKLTT